MHQTKWVKTSKPRVLSLHQQACFFSLAFNSQSSYHQFIAFGFRLGSAMLSDYWIINVIVPLVFPKLSFIFGRNKANSSVRFPRL